MFDGSLDVLNCNAGHLHITFDKNDEADVEKAKRVITDMMKRGYTLLVETPEGLRKVKQFDADAESYVVEFPDTVEPVEDAKPAKKTRTLPMRKTRATGIGPTAGG